MLWAEFKQHLSSLSSAEQEALRIRNSIDSFDRPVLTDDLPEHLALVSWLWLHQHSQIKTLDLRGVACMSLPAELCLHRELGCLFLDLNGLKELPLELGRLPLQTLSLGRNNIERLPSLKECWPTLQELNLGENHIRNIDFDEEWFVFFDRGSIGLNPLTEPIGERWMLRADADEAARRILGVFQAADESCQPQTARTLVQQGLGLLKQIAEPMIDTELYRNCCFEEGVFISPFDASRSWTNYALLEYFPDVPRTALLDPSLWRHRISSIRASHLSLPAHPRSLVEFSRAYSVELEL